MLFSLCLLHWCILGLSETGLNPSVLQGKNRRPLVQLDSILTMWTVLLCLLASLKQFHCGYFGTESCCFSPFCTDHCCRMEMIECTSGSTGIPGILQRLLTRFMVCSQWDGSQYIMRSKVSLGSAFLLFPTQPCFLRGFLWRWLGLCKVNNYVYSKQRSWWLAPTVSFYSHTFWGGVFNAKINDYFAVKMPNFRWIFYIYIWIQLLIFSFFYSAKWPDCCVCGR